MARNRLIKHLIEENRGLKKRLNHIVKASLNNHTGMLYWKRKYNVLNNEVKEVISNQQLDHDSLESINEKRIPTNS